MNKEITYISHRLFAKKEERLVRKFRQRGEDIHVRRNE